jgi:hypothetical protein
LLTRFTVIAWFFASFPPAKFSIEKCLSSKLIVFPMWFYYGEEVLDQNSSLVLDNVLIDCVSFLSKSAVSHFMGTRRNIMQLNEEQL